jgi:hypothetical protein
VERVLADVDTDCCNGFKADGLAWHGMLLVLAVPCHLCGWVGQEHGGSIPLADLAPQRLATASDLGGKQLVILSRRELVAERAAIRGMSCCSHSSPLHLPGNDDASQQRRAPFVARLLHRRLSAVRFEHGCCRPHRHWRGPVLSESTEPMEGPPAPNPFS